MPSGAVIWITKRCCVEMARMCHTKRERESPAMVGHKIKGRPSIFGLFVTCQLGNTWPRSRIWGWRRIQSLLFLYGHTEFFFPLETQLRRFVSTGKSHKSEEGIFNYQKKKTLYWRERYAQLHVWNSTLCVSIRVARKSFFLSPVFPCGNFCIKRISLSLHGFISNSMTSIYY